MNKLEFSNKLADQGISTIPLVPGMKIPAIQWNRWATEIPNTNLRKLWFDNSVMNLGIVTGNRITVADFDDIEAAREAFKKHRDVMKVLVRTRRGVHAYFKYHPLAKTIKGNPDLRNKGGYVVGPLSNVAMHWYKFVKGFKFKNVESLCEMPEEFLGRNRNDIEHRTKDYVKDVRAYCAKIMSIEGDNGSRNLIRAISCLADSGLDMATATIEILKWNETNAKPPWSEQEIARAVTRTFSRKAK